MKTFDDKRPGDWENRHYAMTVDNRPGEIPAYDALYTVAALTLLGQEYGSNLRGSVVVETDAYMIEFNPVDGDNNAICRFVVWACVLQPSPLDPYPPSLAWTS
jgi:hypothetical protein